MIRPLSHEPRAGAPGERPDALLRDPSWLDRLREAGAARAFGRLGRYEVFAEVGRGGQGVVYRALDPDSGETVAVKRLHPARVDRRQVLHQIETEVRAVRALSHPGVVRTRGVEADGSHLLLVMDWVDGVPLTEWAARDGVRRSRGEIVALAARVAEIIAHAHERGVIHRDLKPTNVLVDGDDRPHLLDFGMARLDVETSMSTAASTRFVGTLAYAPPELVERGPAAVDARSDLYSLGVTLYEMLEGRPPCDFGESISSAIKAIVQDEPRPLSGPPGDRGLETILRRVLAKRPEDRHASALELAGELYGYLRGDRPRARPGRGLRFGRWSRRRVAAAAGAALAIGLAATLVGAALDRRPPPGDSTDLQRAGLTLRTAGLGPEANTAWNDADADRMLAAASRAVERDLARDPGAEIEARLKLSRDFAGLGLWIESGREARRALALLESRGARDGPEHVVAAALLALAEASDAERPAAQRRAVHALSRLPDDRQLGTDWLVDLENYARGRINAGRGGEANQAVSRAVALVRRLPEVSPGIRFRILDLRAHVLSARENWPEAEGAYRDAIAERRGIVDQALPVAWSNLGSLLLRKGDPKAALVHLGEAVALRCDFLARLSPGDRGFEAMAADVRRHGLDAARLQALAGLYRSHAPEYLPAMLITARRIAEAEERLGRSASAAALRVVVQAIESPPPAVAAVRG